MSIEAMKQALEALETAWTYDEDNEDGYYFDAIKALRQAIAEAEKQGEPVSGQCRFPNVAWLQCSVEHVRMVLDNPQDWKGYEVRYVYTTPPQRTWVVLTDDEIDQGLCRTPYVMKSAEAWREGVRWAYHQLKEKNT